MRRLTISMIISLSFAALACRPVEQPTSSLMVIDGQVVTKPSQAPGSYGVQYWKDGRPFGAASAVAVGPNTFITNGHVVQGAERADQVRIVDYTGKLVTQFDPGNQSQVQGVVNQKFFSENGQISSANDIGAFVLKSDVPTERFTQGFLPVATNGLKPGDQINLAGNGISDYRALQNPEKFAGDNSGTLRFGSNTVAETGGGIAYINGNAFRTPENESQSVSGPGDSGGSVTTNDANKTPALAGLMSGGTLYNPENKNNPYYDYKSNPEGISDQPNSAYSRLVDISQQQAFLQNVNEQGGNIAIPTYFNPNTRQKFDSTEIESNQTMYGDAWKGAAIVRSEDGNTFSNYSGGGQYKWTGNQGYQWYNGQGEATNNYTNYDAQSKSWTSSQGNAGVSTEVPSNSGTTASGSPVINTPPPDTLGGSSVISTPPTGYE